MAEQVETQFYQEVEKYDYVQFVVPDQNNIPRGKVVTGKFAKKYVKEGSECANMICVMGPDCQLPPATYDVIGHYVPSAEQAGGGLFTAEDTERRKKWTDQNGKRNKAELRPCLDTLTPWPWTCREGRRVGSVLCDLYQLDGSPDLTSPRQLLKAQLAALQERHGLVLKSAFEYEFCVFKADSLQSLGGSHRWLYNTRAWDQNQDIFHELVEVLGQMGIQIVALMPEIFFGMWEITMEPEDGIRGGDLGFYVKNAVKGVFGQRGYTATFMAQPTIEDFGASLQLNHSLWRQDTDGRQQTVMLDEADTDKMSKTAKQWLAGLITHTPALAAFWSPTLNCYRLIDAPLTPSDISWGVEDRSATFRVHNAKNNVYIENRMVSGVCCPYLALAATVAAGLDGLDRELELSQVSDDLPRSLEQALDALEKDSQICARLGERFVQAYLKAKRGYEVQPYKAAGLASLSEQLQFERDMYFDSL